MAFLTCIIPVKDISLISDENSSLRRLRETVDSLLGQYDKDIEIVISHGPGIDITGFSKEIKFYLYEDYDFDFLSSKFTNQNDIVRFDKGQRVYKALKNLKEFGEYVMVVDWDDILSRYFTKVLKEYVVKEYPSAVYIESGYAFDESNIVYKIKSGFSTICGTSIVLKKDIVEHVLSYKEDFEKYSRWFGSHVLVKEEVSNLSKRSIKIEIPLVGYRIGYTDNTSGIGNILRFYLSCLRNKNIKENLIEKILGIRTISAMLKDLC